ncbi:hypothetical protein BT96DRAFT_1080110 [Gymnopus androsaceus JB14]|uniref:Alpha-type protein kinase domain-containing protein n=1 Tax=Gymnopus androsaceus JB14 TaxID=1447944 RepID=A0A6A4I262_9AGAR|nr:hypothetical protein BT96DRAFT_1080110 [Gymnopus androsaceus JB14]
MSISRLTIFQLILDGCEYAAKRFWNIGNTDNSVSVAENQQEVEAEALHLALLACLLAEFKKQAQRKKISIANDVEVTAHKVAVEVITSDDAPLPASEVTAETFASLADGKNSITWLLEPLRPKTETQEWSGTNQHPEHNSKVGSTLTTFVHFAYEWTHKTVVFADMQCKTI